MSLKQTEIVVVSVQSPAGMKSRGTLASCRRGSFDVFKGNGRDGFVCKIKTTIAPPLCTCRLASINTLIPSNLLSLFFLVLVDPVFLSCISRCLLLSRQAARSKGTRKPSALRSNARCQPSSPQLVCFRMPFALLIAPLVVAACLDDDDRLHAMPPP